MEDTICAISTSLGVGAISIIRVSGQEALDIVNKIFKGKDLTKVKSHTINYGYIYDGEKNIDEVLVSVMLAPKTYTKEDVVEINCHGGISTTNKVLELLLENGARLAEPGEFTKRAFLNGRIDLTQAESVDALLKSKSDSAREVALNGVSGSLGKKIKNLRSILVELLANIEVNIDFPEYEDALEITHSNLKPRLTEVLETLKDLLATARNGKIISEGLNVAIVGRPNVGKSSILNSLLEEEKAIVTDIAGTTRDIIEGSATLNGILINFIDTAGIRETEDVVEKIGVDKSIAAIDSADLVILVLNNNEELTDEDKELLEKIKKYENIIFINKTDLERKLLFNKDDFTIVDGNTKEISGLDNLKKEIINKFNLEKIETKDMTYLSNVRQIDLTKKALKAVEHALANLDELIPVDMLAIDIKQAWDLLGEIIGENYQDALLDELFTNFCLGK
ncbi:MAG: tRNA uridine-5-carboxymethylaminomethyl(34) synthesis GTPase MnmE [Bacilli bacterium]|nr:tRNA uridine-5-carboxymethylaminomethyl(34) synthesis GTPase MnmE [Bacilli bacterium]